MNTLPRANLSLGPETIDIIEKNLYLGGLTAAKNLETLHKYKITHIITIETCPLPRHILEQKHITTKHIQLSDHPKEDLLSYFDETDEFIKEGSAKGVVFVHCYFGVSRSATVIIAHLMKKYQLNYYEAFERVKAKRRIVDPNRGFVSQLKLYQEMGYTINPTNMNFKIFRLTVAGDGVRKVKILPQNFHELVQPDPGLTHSHPKSNIYRCKKCRRVLASKSNLILHRDKRTNCTKTYFIEPMAWMNVTQVTQGKVMCPKCKSKLGSFSWILGCKCPCGKQVAPAFYLTPSKVDFTNV